MGFTLSKHMSGSEFSWDFFHTYTLHTCFRGHSPYTYLVYTLQAHVNFQIFTGVHLFILILPTHVSVFTLHIFILFTLSKHSLGSKFSNFHRSFFFILTLSTHVSVFTLHAVVFTLSKQMLHFIKRIFIDLILFMLTLGTHVLVFILQTVLCVHSPSRCLVYSPSISFFLIFTGFHFSLLSLFIQI